MPNTSSRDSTLQHNVNQFHSCRQRSISPNFMRNHQWTNRSGGFKSNTVEDPWDNDKSSNESTSPPHRGYFGHNTKRKRAPSPSFVPKDASKHSKWLFPSHSFSFKLRVGESATAPVNDEKSDLCVHLMGTAVRDAERGLVLKEGGQGWAEIDGWEWGSGVSFEVFVKISHDTDTRQSIFDFGCNDDNVNLALDPPKGAHDAPSLRWSVRKNGKNKTLVKKTFSRRRMHIVVTTNDYAMHAFVNGELLFSKSKPLSTYDYRPERVSRLSHVLGATKSVDGGEAAPRNFMVGNIQHLRIWHGHELSLGEIKCLYDCASADSRDWTKERIGGKDGEGGEEEDEEKPPAQSASGD
ncbi:hypothetical protein TrLO_g8666 [Triparma laevis f. longispina]|uniref:Uncharacterized protein n=1 Tax=Triparma laevis f. longispina TaxID=1714387 RepID=A0A9W7DQP0_9STRA|nr:hypothetical protein TrLO_g8666 [Triparma laevis f. longispina]